MACFSGKEGVFSEKIGSFAKEIKRLSINGQNYGSKYANYCSQH